MHASADQPVDRLPPHDLAAERSLLASMMLDSTIIPIVTGTIAVESFYQPDHGVIFGALVSLWNLNRPIDAVSTLAELERIGEKSAVGGIQTIADILAAVPSAAHFGQYARIVHDLATWRGLIQAGNNALRLAQDRSRWDSAAEAVQAVMTDLARLNAAADATECVKLGTVAEEVFERCASGEGVKLIPTGIKPIDSVFGGLGLGEMLVIGARPSMGKSTLGRQIAAAAAVECKVPTLIVSNEESREKIARNLLSAYGSIENNKIRRGTLDPAEINKMAGGLAAIGDNPCYIRDRAFRISVIRSAVALAVAKFGVQLVIVDYLQRVRAPGKDRYEQVTNASLELSQMFKELNVAGVVMAQLKREVTSRQDKRPTMSDLRESGQIEQDADQIIFLHREDYYRKSGEADGEMDQVAELLLAKVRDGVRGDTIQLKTMLRYQRFDEWQPADPFQQ